MGVGRVQNISLAQGRMLATLSYLTVLCIIPLTFKKDNPFVLFHSKQGLVLFMAEVAIFIAHIVLGPKVLWLGVIIFCCFSLWGIVQALKGQYVRLPLVANLAEKIVL